MQIVNADCYSYLSVIFANGLRSKGDFLLNAVELICYVLLYCISFQIMVSVLLLIPSYFVVSFSLNKLS